MCITSQERRDARYHRRVLSRMNKKASVTGDGYNFDTIFSYDNLYKSYKKCRCGVSWKGSTQKYISNAPINVYKTYRDLSEDRFKTCDFHEFDIKERGKTRHIKSVMINERVVQRCLCDYALVPALSRTFIYDNGASLSNKGYSFAVSRCSAHLEKYYRQYGCDGYVLLFDFSKFFDNVSHQVISDAIKREFNDRKVIDLCDKFISSFGDVGLGLGSQVSQILALSSANRLDHYIKEVLRIKYYVRYMDDGFILHNSKEYLKECMAQISRMCDLLGIKLNRNKTKIVKLSHGFTFLKVKFNLLDSGKIIKRMNHDSIVRERRKLKAFKSLVESGAMSYEDVYASWQSWSAYASNFNSYYSVCNMRKLYKQLFSDYLR